MNKDTQHWRYELEVIEIGQEGNCLLKVWTYSKKLDRAIAQAKLNAIHGILYKGYAAKPGISAMKPLITDKNLTAEKRGFLDLFFSKNGSYLKFVQVSNDPINYNDVFKIGKEYKVGVTLFINKVELRKYLEDNQVINRLGNIF